MGRISLLRREPASHPRSSRTTPSIMMKVEYVTAQVDIPCVCQQWNIVDPRKGLPPQGTRIEPIIYSNPCYTGISGNEHYCKFKF